MGVVELFILLKGFYFGFFAFWHCFYWFIGLFGGCCEILAYARGSVGSHLTGISKERFPPVGSFPFRLALVCDNDAHELMLTFIF